MREIKFRAWFKDGGQDRKGHMGTLNSEEIDDCIEDGIPVMQFTGLHDKNGQEIYEGDLLQVFDQPPAQVKFGEHCTNEGSPIGWYAEWPCGTQGFLNTSWQEAEIVGNIYETPELLK